MNRIMPFLAATLLAAFAATSNASAWDRILAAPALARPPVWAAQGAYVFRVSTPDEADVLPRLEEGHAIVANLLDGTVPQITIVNGLIGHDHPGAWNWDRDQGARDFALAPAADPLHPRPGHKMTR